MNNTVYKWSITFITSMFFTLTCCYVMDIKQHRKEYKELLNDYLTLLKTHRTLQDSYFELQKQH